MKAKWLVVYLWIKADLAMILGIKSNWKKKIEKYFLIYFKSVNMTACRLKMVRPVEQCISQYKANNCMERQKDKNVLSVGKMHITFHLFWWHSKTECVRLTSQLNNKELGINCVSMSVIFEVIKIRFSFVTMQMVSSYRIIMVMMIIISGSITKVIPWPGMVCFLICWQHCLWQHGQPTSKLKMEESNTVEQKKKQQKNWIKK